MAGLESTKPVQQSRQPGNSWDMYDDGSAPEYYVDGFGGILLGPAVSRVTMFKTVDIIEEGGENIERRKVAVRFVVPTAALAEWMALGLQTISAHRQAISQNQQRLSDVIERAAALGAGNANV